MDFLKQIWKQFKSIYSKMTPSQKVSFVLVIASIGICLVVVALWSASPDYVVLFSDLSTEDAAKIHAKLNELKIPYDVEGTTIKVPSQHVYETRLTLANEGLPKGANVGYEIFDKTTMGQTDYIQRLNFQRALEGELSRTISSLETVEFARVHLVLPKPTIFSEKEEKVSASIIVTTRNGNITKSNVVAITHLVSSSVEGLEPSEVTIIDSSGNLLSSVMDENIAVSLTSSQLEAQKNIERYLETKVSSLLTGVLGPGKAIVRVTADVDFSQKESTAERYNPESQVARSENRIEESSSMGEDQDSTVEKTITNFEINKTVEHIIGATGQVSRLSIAVVIDGTYRFEGDGRNREKVYVPRTEEEKESIRRLVVSSIGISEERADTVEVINIPFDNSYLEEQEILMQKVQREQLIRSVLEQWPWVVVGVIFIVLFISLQKIISQASLTRVAISSSGAGRKGGGTRRSQAEDEMYERIREQELEDQDKESQEAMAERMLRERVEAEVSHLAQQNPDAVAKVIKGWLSED